MNRRLLALVLVLVVAGGVAALLLTARGSVAHPGRLVGLRTAAALEPCPSGLGPALPPVLLPCLGGAAPVRLGTGRPPLPMLVNIWATWCSPCVREVPLLLSFSAAAHGRVGVVGVLHEDEPAQALEFARQYGMHYPSLVDADGRVLRSFGSGPPITLLLDGAGRVRYVQRGAFHSLAEIRALVRRQLGVTV